MKRILQHAGFGIGTENIFEGAADFADGVVDADGIKDRGMPANEKSVDKNIDVTRGSACSTS